MEFYLLHRKSLAKSSMMSTSPVFPADAEPAFLTRADQSQRRHDFKCGQVYADVELSLKTEEERVIYEKIHRASVAEIDSSLEITQKLGKNSASPTVQYLADLLGSRVFLKVSFEEEEGKGEVRYRGLRAEQRIYAEVANQLLFSRATPHLVAYYGLAHLNQQKNSSSAEREGRRRSREACTGTRSRSRSRSRGGLKLTSETKKYLSERGFNPEKPIALILEAEEYGVTLDNLEKEYGREVLRSLATATRDPYIDALMQVLWTLECFRQVGLQHNDLHWGNVFVRVYEQPVSFVYRITEHRSVVMNTCIQVQLYDYDASQKFATAISPCQIHNERLEDYECPALGVNCSKVDTARDIIRFVYHYAKMKPINAYGRLLIDTELYDLEYLKTLDRRGGAVWYGFPCRGDWAKLCKEPIEYDMFFRRGRSPLQHFMTLAAMFGLDKNEPLPAQDLCLLTNTFVLPEQTGELVEACGPGPQ